jgi:hypothetical protein
MFEIGESVPLRVKGATLEVVDIRPINETTTDYVWRLYVLNQFFLVDIRIILEDDIGICCLGFVKEDNLDREVQNINGFGARHMFKCFMDLLAYIEYKKPSKWYLAFSMFLREESRIRAHRAIIKRYANYAPAEIYSKVRSIYPENLENAILFVLQRPEKTFEKEEDMSLESLGIDLTKL